MPQGRVPLSKELSNSRMMAFYVGTLMPFLISFPHYEGKCRPRAALPEKEEFRFPHTDLASLRINYFRGWRHYMYHWQTRDNCRRMIDERIMLSWLQYSLVRKKLVQCPSPVFPLSRSFSRKRGDPWRLLEDKFKYMYFKIDIDLSRLSIDFLQPKHSDTCNNY